MTSTREQSVYLSVTLAGSILFVAAGILAALTVLTHTAQVCGLAFRTYVLLGVLVAGGALAGTGWQAYRRLKCVTVRDYRVLVFVLALCAVGSGLALVIHRPDSDDSHYVPNAVYYVQNSDAAMGFNVHGVYVRDAPFVSHMTNTALAYEYAQAIVAHVTGLEYLVVYHLVFAALGGGILPLVMFYALSRFCKQPAANAVGVLVMIGVMLLLGETHRAVGNLSFARAYHGKALFLSGAIPLFAAFSLTFLRRPSLAAWWPVCATAIAAVGMTASAAVILPALASVLVLAHLGSTRSPGHAWARVIPYFAALFYVVWYALAIRSHALAYAGVDSPQNAGWPRTFWGHAAFFINTDTPLSPVVAAASIICTLLLYRQTRELSLWMLGSVVLYLNPLVAPVLITHVTSPNIYWRMFYIFPFPLAIGVAVSAVWSRAGAALRGRRGAVAVSLCTLVLVLLQLPLKNVSIFRPGNRVMVGRPRIKVDDINLAVARKVVRYAPSGVMLAPRAIADTVSMLSSRHPQMRTREGGIPTWFAVRERSEEAALRMDASDFTGGIGRRFDALATLLQMYPEVQSIVLAASAAGREDVKALLHSRGFVSRREVGARYTLAWR